MVRHEQQESSVDGAPDNRFESSGGRDRAWAMPESGLGADAPGMPLVGDHVPPAGSTVIDRDPDRGRERQAWDGGRGDDRSRIAAGPPPLPVPLEPMTVSDLLDGAWAIVKSRPRTVLSVTAIIVVPIELVSAFLQHRVSRGFDLTSLFVTQPGTNSSSVPGLGLFGAAYLASALTALSYFFLGGALARLVSSWYAGGDLSAKQAVLASLRKGTRAGSPFLPSSSSSELRSSACSSSDARMPSIMCRVVGSSLPR